MACGSLLEKKIFVKQFTKEQMEFTVKIYWTVIDLSSK